ncbi:MAG: hypothetical protein JWL86_6831 [Rhizobium sp.]|nr:hypothetical protein [Rhizobium sp.]
MIFHPHQTHLFVHAGVSAPWFGHARPRSLCLGMRDRPGHVSVPQLDDRPRSRSFKTRIRAPYSVVFPCNSGSSASPNGPCRLSSRTRRHPMSTPRHPSLAWRSRDHHPRIPFGPPMPHRHARAFFSPEENHSLHGPDHEALRRLPMTSTGSAPPTSPCGVAEGRTRGIVPWSGGNGKRCEDYFPTI